MSKERIKVLINDKLEEYDLLYTFESNITNNNYLVCTDNKINENGKLNTYAFIYFPSNKEKGIVPIKEEKDWNEVKRFINVMDGDINE